MLLAHNVYSILARLVGLSKALIILICMQIFRTRCEKDSCMISIMQRTEMGVWKFFQSKQQRQQHRLLQGSNLAGIVPRAPIPTGHTFLW